MRNGCRILRKLNLIRLDFYMCCLSQPEKGIYEFLEMFKNMNADASVSIIGKTKNLSTQERFKTLIGNNKNIKFPGYVSDRQLLINTYDDHNIFSTTLIYRRTLMW